ncbi:pectin lyase-like protein [Paraphaeosphaeria sporulosa]|uniref:Pectin lyase-like protein n=1 Tax=Paraphaeosphaeria sporulosa TaxID=1460663 RepID=A0A177CV31_9PLEO|nr:pectin lyase-like protein [Paraphaeosphaeria sporulosa]OAG10762.1 pectin lyase-like protein [Paraphaeosphaeria sporulosa]
MSNLQVSGRGPIPRSITYDKSFDILARLAESEESSDDAWVPATAYTTRVADVDTTRNEFNTYPVAVASLSVTPRRNLHLRICYKAGQVETASVLPASHNIVPTIEGNTITFSLDRALDLMLEINGDKWQALHLLVNTIDDGDPKGDEEGVWYFGPGVNKSSATEKISDGMLVVPSNTTVYLARDAFVTAQIVFANVENSAIKGPGFICRDDYDASLSSRPRELAGGAILIERSRNILVQQVTSLRSFGFSLPIGQGRDIHIDCYRSFSSHGNGDGIDLFCCQHIVIENCFLRNSDDTIAIYGHRWEYQGDTEDIRIRNCTLLPDIAHPIQIGTHGHPEVPETLSNIHISNIDILDHSENQLWYQGCIAINAGDANLVQDILVENVRVERITRGQLFNIRVMKNAMWTTAPGLGIRNVTFRNIEFNLDKSKTVNPSQILGFDASRPVENVTFENLKVGGSLIHDHMSKPRWYLTSDFIPMFVNEHANNVTFRLGN